MDWGRRVGWIRVGELDGLGYRGLGGLGNDGRIDYSRRI